MEEIISPKKKVRIIKVTQEGKTLYPSSRPIGTISLELSEEYREYQENFTSSSLGPRFDTNQCSEERFKDLARDPCQKKYQYERITIDGFPSGK